MRLRVVLLEANDAISDSLRLFLEELGHDAITDETVIACPHFHNPSQICTQERSCGDALILGQQLPGLKGIELIERRLRGGCKGLAANVALICRPWSDHDRHRAESLGCRCFETPLHLTELAGWLELVAQRIDPRRQLAPLSPPA